MPNSVIKPGILEVYCGPMKSGKTLVLAQRLEKLKYMTNADFQVFSPDINTRDDELNSRFGFGKTNFIKINHQKPEEIFDKIGYGVKLIAIDEVQFFDKKLERVVEELLLKDANIITAGLDLDFRGEPFGIIPFLLAKADYVEKLTGICEYCKKQPSTRTQRLINGEPAPYDAPLISVEGSNKKETYETRCLKHHIVPGKP